MAQNTETVLSQVAGTSSNLLSIVLGVGSGVVTSTTHSLSISTAESIETIYYAALGGAVSICVKLLGEAAFRWVSAWLDKRFVPANGTVTGASIGAVTGANTGADTGRFGPAEPLASLSTTELLPQ